MDKIYHPNHDFLLRTCPRGLEEGTRILILRLCSINSGFAESEEAAIEPSLNKSLIRGLLIMIRVDSS